jgi:hypothetical protein
MAAAAAPSFSAGKAGEPSKGQANGPATEYSVQGDQDSSVIGERNSARASGETPGGESPRISPAQGLRGWTDWSVRSPRREEPDMRKLFAALAITAASLALFEGCAPVPLPHYAAYKPRRVEELLVDSENLRQAGDEWERAWLLDQPSHLTPFRTHGGVGP